MKKTFTKTLAVMIVLVIVMSCTPLRELSVFAQDSSATENAIYPVVSDTAVLPSPDSAPQVALSTVDHIAVTKVPDKTDYVYGADTYIDYTGLELTVYYTDTTSDIYRFNDLQDYYFNGEYVAAYFIDFETGIVQVDYLSKSTTFNVTILANPVDHVEVTKLPYTTVYTDGVDYNVDYFGFELTVYYTDATSAVYRYNDLQDYYFNGYYVFLYFSDYVNGIVDVEYMGSYATFNVTVVPNPVDYIEVTKLPDKTEYITGVDNGFSFIGLEMTVYYTDSTSAVYNYSDYGSYFNRYFVNGYFIDQAGTCQVDYMGKSTTFSIIMVANPVSSIEVTKVPNKTDYIDGVDNYYVDRAGMEMTIHYTDSTSAVYRFDNDGYTFYAYYIGVDFADFATGSVSVTYMGKTAGFNVTIIPNPVDHIAVTKLPDKTEYISGIYNPVDYTGMEVTVYYTDGSSTVYSYDIDGYSFNGYFVEAYFPDIQTGTIQVGYMSKTATFDVSFTSNPVDHIAVTKLPDKTSYIFSVEGSADCMGMELTIYYTNGTSAVYAYDMNAYYNGYYINAILYYSYSNAQNGAVQVEYMGKYTSFDVAIAENPVLHIEITKLPDKTEYVNGAETYIDYTGMELTVYYADSTSAVYRYNDDGYKFNGYDVFAYFDNYQAGSVVVDYLGKTAFFSVTIVENPIDHIEIKDTGNTVNNDLLYIGDLTGLTIRVYKNDTSDFSVAVPDGYTAEYTWSDTNETYTELLLANSYGTFFMSARIHYTVLNSLRTGVSSIEVNYMGKTATIIPLVAPTLNASPATPINGDVTVTITYPGTAAITECKTGTGAWEPYSGSVSVSANDTVYARYMDTSGNKSNIGFVVIGNIRKLIAFDGSLTVINDATHFICGLVPGITKDVFESSYVQIMGDAKLVYTPDISGLGTGTKVDLVDNATSEIVTSYYIVIFGDVNGDGNIDSIDAGKVVDFENSAITWDPTADAALFKAGDVNGDGNIDSIDAGIVVDTKNGRLTIDQTTGLAV